MQFDLITQKLIVANNQQAFNDFLQCSNIVDERSTEAALHTLIETVMENAISPVLAHQYLNEFDRNVVHIREMIAYGVFIALDDLIKCKLEEIMRSH